MALAVARLRLAALAALHRHPRGLGVALLPWVVAVLVAVGAVALAVQGILPATVSTAAVVLASAGVGLLGRSDGALDPRAFRGVVRWVDVALGTALGALVSPLTVAAVGVGVAASLDDGASPSAARVAAGVGAGLLLAVTAALARLVADLGQTGAARPWLAVAALVVLGAAAVAPLLLGWSVGTSTLAASPFAAATAWLVEAGRLPVALGTIAALALAWTGIVAWRTAHPGRPRQRAPLGLLRVAIARPWSVVAARTVTGWARDRRYHANAIAVLALPLLLAVPLALAGLPRETWTLLPVGVLALFLGWSLHDDTAYDGSAWWMHLSARVPGWQDRLGRALPLALVASVLVGAASVLGVRLHGDVDLLPGVLGSAFALLGAGLGVSSIVSARWPYAVSGPEASVFQAPASQSWAAACTQAGALVAAVALAAPIVVPVVQELGDPTTSWGWAGAGYGAALMLVGIAIGGRVIDVRGPEVLAAAMRD